MAQDLNPDEIRELQNKDSEKRRSISNNKPRSIDLSSDKKIAQGQRTGLDTAKAIYGQDLFEIGDDVKKVKKFREDQLDSKDPASTRIRNSKNAKIRSARASGANAGQEAQIERQASFDIGQSEYRSQSQAYDSYQKLVGNMVGGTMSMMNATGQLEKAGEKVAAPVQSGGICCFIFLESRYGDGTMDSVVRRYRDEMLTEKNKRGYYKFSEVIVPLMRKSKIVKLMVSSLMTTPMFLYGKYYYGEGKLGVIFKPVADSWIRLFDFLGGDHKFIRENGEIV